MTERGALLAAAAAHVAEYRDRVDDLPVFPTVPIEEMRRRLGALGDQPTPAAQVIDELVAAADGALVGTAGPRYFGFVIGGAVDAALAADVLAVGWDQNAYNATSSPLAAVAEEVAGGWLKELLCVPASASVGFVAGGQGGNTVSLAAARHRVLAAVGWDVEQRGLNGAPRVRIVGNGERHGTIDRALRLLGFGNDALEPVATGAQGEIDVADLARVLDSGERAPTIVVLQAGNVNTGAFDDFAAAIDVAKTHDAWVHVDGAFGLWAGASASLRHLVAGIERADSWGADGHKWLNVPYDCGYAFCADPEAHAAAMSYTGAYLTGQNAGGLRAPGDFVLESSRRARGFATWAALRELGRNGVEAMIDGCCSHARLFASLLADVDGVEIANDVVLNQVLVRFGDDDVMTDRVVATVQASGECWMGTTVWHGRKLMRISVSSWRTTEADVQRSVAAIVAALDAVRAEAGH